LFQEVSDWIEQQPIKRIGLIVFVRRDMLVASVRQNSGQLESRYLNYALKWDEMEALRLVYWVVAKSIPDIFSEDAIDDFDKIGIVEKLSRFWGHKLGKKTAREARTSEWVLAALSDFKHQIQARDLIRLIKTAADYSIRDAYWNDRVLTPTAIKRAILACGKEKVAEIGDENFALKEIFSLLQGSNPDSKQVPISTEKIGLDPRQN